MSGRQSNTWGECVWCGEILTPEDPDPYSDRCAFCLRWNSLIGLCIKREFIAKKNLKNADNKGVEQYWTLRKEIYQDIQEKLRTILSKKKHIWGESY